MNENHSVHKDADEEIPDSSDDWLRELTDGIQCETPFRG